MTSIWTGQFKQTPVAGANPLLPDEKSRSPSLNQKTEREREMDRQTD